MTSPSLPQKPPTGFASKIDKDGQPSWIRYVAAVTGALAAVAGYLTVRSAVLSDQAIYHSNQGVLFQAQASDAWAEYQADSIKARIVATAAATTADPAVKADLQKQADELRSRQPDSKANAQAKQATRDFELKNGAKQLGERDILQYAGMAIQLGIALASVAALTKRYEAFAVGVFVGAIGVAITGYAQYYHYFVVVK
jgi:hypothetical protein